MPDHPRPSQLPARELAALHRDIERLAAAAPDVARHLAVVVAAITERARNQGGA